MWLINGVAVLQAVLVCGTALPLSSQQPSISIESKNPVVGAGQPIQVHIVLKNTTDRQFTVFRSIGGSRGELHYSISVIDPDGNPATRTAYGTAVQKNQVFPLSRIMKTILPGEDVDENVDISRLFEMGAGGEYSVQVTRASPLNPSVILKSNRLSITVR
jgi:hypothetical protein